MKHRRMLGVPPYAAGCPYRVVDEARGLGIRVPTAGDPLILLSAGPRAPKGVEEPQILRLRFAQEDRP